MRNVKVFLVTFFFSLAFFGGVVAVMIYPSTDGFDYYIEADIETPGIEVMQGNISGTALFEINTRSDGVDSTKILLRLSPTDNTLLFSVIPNDLVIGDETIRDKAKQSNLYNMSLEIAEEYSILIDRYAFLSYGDMLNILNELPTSYIEIDNDIILTEQTSRISFTLQSGKQELNPITFLSLLADPNISENLKNTAIKEILKAVLQNPQTVLTLFEKYEDGSFGGRDILAAEIFIEKTGELGYDIQLVAPIFTESDGGVYMSDEEKAKFTDYFS